MTTTRARLAVLISTCLLFLLWINAAFPSNVAIVITMGLLCVVLGDRLGINDRRLFVLLAASAGYLCLLWSLSLALNGGIPQDPFLQDTRKLLLAFFYHVMLFVLFTKNRAVLTQAISYTLWILVGFWWIQALIFYGSGYYLDPLDLLGIREQKEAAYFLKGALQQLDIVRPTSFFNEPGTYGSTTITLVSIYYLLHRKIKFPVLAAVVSMVLSLSTFSILAASIFLLLVIIDKIVIGSALKKTFWLIAGGVSCFAILQIAQNYIEVRTTYGGGFIGAQFRESLFSDWLSFPIGRKLLGSGLFASETDAWSTASFPALSLDPAIRILGDVSLAFYLLVTLGLWVVPLVVIFGYYCRDKMRFLFFSIVFMMKLDLTVYALWTTLSCMYLCLPPKDGVRGGPALGSRGKRPAA